jgi:hypothetical protein
VTAVIAMERQVLGSPGIDGIVLRYGRLYGPGTWYERPGRRPGLHVDAAAHAALLAVTRGAPGIYNIADDDGTVSIAKARAELGFDPAFRSDHGEERIEALSLFAALHLEPGGRPLPYFAKARRRCGQGVTFGG